MKLLTTASFLSTLALANPISPPSSDLLARQPSPRARFTGAFSFSNTANPGCSGATVAFSNGNELATVTFPNYSVSLPSRPTASCAVSLTVLFPLNQCTTGTALGHVSGRVNLPDRPAQQITASFDARDWAVSPDANTTQISNNGRWVGPTAGEEEYTLEDQVSWWYTPRTPENANVRFTLQGQLQLQPTNAGAGFLSNDRVVFDISQQIPC